MALPNHAPEAQTLAAPSPEVQTFDAPPIEDPTATDWQADAACRDEDPRLFFPVREDDAGPARSICATCPVADACREWAVATRQSDGIWGGMTPIERHRLVRRRQKAARKARSEAA